MQVQWQKSQYAQYLKWLDCQPDALFWSVCIYESYYVSYIGAGRMGNQERALKLIINELQDVDKVDVK